MKTKLLPTILLGLALGFAAFNADAQNPGGVAIAPTIWYQASAYGTSWANAGSLGSAADLTVTGAPTFSSSGDSLSNYNPYVLFAATGQYASTPAPGLSAANVAALGNTHTTFAAVTNQNTSSNNTTSSSPFFFGNSGGTLDQPGLGFSQNGNSTTPIYAMMDYYYHSTGSSEYSYQFTGNGITAGSSVVLMGQADPVTGATNNLNISYNGQGSTVYMNGIGQTYSLGTANGNNSSVAGGTNANQNYVFVGDVNQYAMTGRVQEIVMFNAVLTNTQSKQVNTYLAVKNGVTLGHDYIDAAGNTIYSLSTNSGNVSNIFGVGAEAANGSLNQPQSNSVSDKRSIVVSDGSHIGTDDSYLMFGANGIPAASQNYANGTVFGGNSVTTTTILNAISEKWATQSTVGGAAGGSWTVTINAGRIAQNGYVLVSSDSTFPAATTSAYALSSGVADNVNIPSGAYVTIAYLQIAPGGITTAPSVWYKSNDAASSGWTDAMGQLNLTAVGSGGLTAGTVTVNPGDAGHNFNTWTTGYSNSSYYNWTSSTNPVFGAYGDTTGNYHYSALTIFGAAKATAFTTGTHQGMLTGIDRVQANAEEPGLDLIYSGGNVYPRFYRFDNGGTAWDNAYSTSQPIPVGATSIYMCQPPPGNGSSPTNGGTLTLGLNGNYATVTNMSQRSIVEGPYLKIGYNAQDNDPFPGAIQEVIWYKSTLSADDIKKVETYLALKFGTTLAHDYINAGGNTIYSLTTNIGNVYNIAGIGHEIINGGLDQRQSNSANTGNQILISTTGLDNTNDANSIGLADGQYLVWGDNGLNKAPAVVVTNIPGTNYRFGSVWKVQNTGSVGTVRVAWPAQFATIKLVQSSDSTFAAGNTVTDMSSNTQVINGVTYNYADVTLADGQYFTIAADVSSPGGIATLPAVWYRSDSVSAAVWKDASLNKLDLSGQGTITVNAGNQAHNFNTWTTKYSTANYYSYLATTNPVFGTWADGGVTTTASTDYSSDGYYYMPLTVFGVARDTLSTGGNGAITGIDNDQSYGAEPGLGVYGGKESFYRFGNGADVRNNAAAIVAPANASAVYSWRPPAGGSAATGNDTLLMGLNGTYSTFQINRKSSVAGPHLNIGTDNFAYGVFPGDIQEVIWYKDSLSYAAIQKVETYLAIKYGTTLTHSYVNANGDTIYNLTTNASYTSNIAGIGHEAANGGLDQRQSNSVNPGTQVLISTTGLDNTNDANSVGLADGQYLVWGDNGLSKSPGILITGVSNVNYRFKAVWKVQNTGAVGTVRVAWPVGLTNLKLIQSSDPTFATGNTGTDMTANTQTVNGVTYNYADVTLTDGQYFTFAAYIAHAPGGVAAGLSYWYRADKNATNTGSGTDVTNWADYVSGTPVGQLGTNAMPKYNAGAANYFNFNPGLQYTDGTQTLGNLSAQTVTDTSYDIFTLTKEGIQSGGGNPRVFSSLVDNSQTTGNIHYWDGIGLNADGNIERENVGYTLHYYANPGGISYATNAPSIMYNTFTNNTVAKGLNGAVTGATGNLGSFGYLNGGFAFGSTVFASNGSDNAGFIGNLGETIIYGSNNVTAEERNRVDAYLAIKYGITLDKNESYLASNSNVVWDKTDNADYYNNIAGIARDDISDLNQKQSRSQITNNVNGEITIGLGTIATDNVSNTSSFTSDQTWFIWGDNGVTTTLDAANTAFTAPGESGARMNRIWKAVNTGLGQAVQLQFPQASISATTGAHYVLAIASDENFTTNVSTVDLATDGSNYTVSFTPRSGTFYFTFARIDAATPVNLQNFTVTTANCNAVLSWTGATESNFNYYEVQTSTDGTSFTPGQQIAGTGSGSHYTAQVTLSAATEYIRLEMVDKDGSIRYSDIYTASSNCAAGTPVLYPNPASDVFNITNLGSGQKHIQVFSASGALIYKGQTTADKATVNVKGWASGLYMVSVVTGNGKTISFKVIVK